MPLLLSDYTARPFILDWCSDGPLDTVLDLGCGEGYFARQLKKRGANHILGIDISEEMIKRAKEQQDNDSTDIVFQTGTATALDKLSDGSFDLVVAVFLFNYLTIDESVTVMKEIYRILKTNGLFVFAVPHPSLPFQHGEAKPFYFSKGDNGYFSGRDRLLEGKIWRRDGEAVPVRCVHKTLEDYFACMHAAAFHRLPDIKELHITKDILAADPAFFEPLIDQPLHLAFKMEK
jgi:SAM-dependent methyltransferase